MRDPGNEVVFRVVCASYGLGPPSGMRNSIYSDNNNTYNNDIIIIIVVVVVVVVDLPALACLHP